MKATKATLLSTPPKKRTLEARLQIFIENYRKTGRIVPACKAAGIDHSTHYRRFQSDAAYRERVEEAEQQSAQYLEDTLFDMAMERDIQALLALLKRFRPQLYRERISAEISGDISIGDMLTEARARVISITPDDRTGTKS